MTTMMFDSADSFEPEAGEFRNKRVPRRTPLVG
jgi:hypothetical protein